MQAHPTWQVVSGLVGTVKVVVPITSLGKDPLRLVLEDTHLTVQPRVAARPVQASGKVAQPSQAQEGFGGAGSPGEDDVEQLPVLGPFFNIQEGIKAIAGTFENILQKLCFEVSPSNAVLSL